jgi:hypothetical protein
MIKLPEDKSLFDLVLEVPGKQEKKENLEIALEKAVQGSTESFEKIVSKVNNIENREMNVLINQKINTRLKKNSHKIANKLADFKMLEQETIRISEKLKFKDIKTLEIKNTQNKENYKIAVIADIHVDLSGKINKIEKENERLLEILKFINEYNPTDILFLGDFIENNDMHQNRYSDLEIEANAITEMVLFKDVVFRELVTNFKGKIYVTPGNHDRQVLATGKSKTDNSNPNTPSHCAILEQCYKDLVYAKKAKAKCIFAKSEDDLSVFIPEINTIAHHGHVVNVLTPTTDFIEKKPDYIFNGHFHTEKESEYNGIKLWQLGCMTKKDGFYNKKYGYKSVGKMYIIEKEKSGKLSKKVISL